MVRGRVAVPDAIRQLRGTHRDDRHGDASRMLRANEAEPTAPADFNAAELAIWQHLLDEMKPLGTWSASFSLVIEVLARNYVTWRQCLKDVRERGPVLINPRLRKDGSLMIVRAVPTKDGPRDMAIFDHRTNPAQTASIQLSKEIRGVCAQLGLDPVSLSRIVTQDPNDDEFDGANEYPMLRFPDGQASSLDADEADDPEAAAEVESETRVDLDDGLDD